MILNGIYVTKTIIVDLVTYIDFGISGLSVHLMSTQLSIFLCDCLKDRYFTIILLKSLEQLEEVSIKVILKVHVKYETLQLQNTGMLFVMISKSYIRKRYFFKLMKFIRMNRPLISTSYLCRFHRVCLIVMDRRRWTWPWRSIRRSTFWWRTWAILDSAQRWTTILRFDLFNMKWCKTWNSVKLGMV